MGGYLGAAFPLGHYRDTVDTGGVAGGWGGYRWMMSPIHAISLIGGPEFTLMPRENCPAGPNQIECHGGNPASTFSFTAGPKFSIVDKGWELSVAALGGYFRDINGPLQEKGGGLAVHGAVTHEAFAPGFQLGVFVRFEEAFLRPAINTDRDDRQLIMAGLSFGWSPAEAAVVETAPPPPPPPPPPAPIAKKKLVLRGVNFDFDKATLQPAGVPILQEAAKILNNNPGVSVEVQGYTDSIGTDAYNLRLSQRRANTVKGFLVKQGVSSSRLTTKGYGESNPVASNETAEGRAQNRRVELVPQP
ncbi:MAG TPA: OmpA family protein [Candidatus Binatia bacterium]|nr:OmpA family protein [Candidatus Binatia bacterium]